MLFRSEESGECNNLHFAMAWGCHMNMVLLLVILEIILLITMAPSGVLARPSARPTKGMGDPNCPACIEYPCKC